MYNRQVKFELKIPNRFEKKCQKTSGGDFCDSHCIVAAGELAG